MPEWAPARSGNTLRSTSVRDSSKEVDELVVFRWTPLYDAELVAVVVAPSVAV